jgi:hypothetical protein
LAWHAVAVSRRLTTRRVFIVGAGCTAVGVLWMALMPGISELLVFLGLILVVGSAAAYASNGRQGGVDRARRATTVVVVVLTSVLLVPFAVLTVLVLLHAEPLAVFLIGLGLFAMSGILVVVFVVVFFASRWRHRQASGAPQRLSA